MNAPGIKFFEYLFLGAFSIFVFFLPISIAGMELGAFLIITTGACFLISCWKYKENIKYFYMPDRWISIGLIALFVAITISGLLNTKSAKMFMVQFMELRYLLLSYFCYVGIQLIPDRAKTILFRVFTIQLGIVASFCLWQQHSEVVVQGISFVRAGGVPFRVRGFFSNPMTYAYFSGVFTMFLIGKNMVKKKSPFEFIVIGLLLVALALTYTRGAWLALLVCFCILGLRLPKRKFFYLIMASFVAIVVAVQLKPGLLDRALELVSKESSSREIRLELWTASLELSKNNLIFGTGMRSLSGMLPAWYAQVGSKYNFVGHAHNNYLEVLVGQGLFGLFIYLFFYIRILVASLKALRVSSISENYIANTFGFGALLGVIFFHLGGLTESTILDYEVVYGLGFCLAWLFYLIKVSSLTRNPS